jgi:hypothetical protein
MAISWFSEMSANWFRPVTGLVAQRLNNANNRPSAAKRVIMEIIDTFIFGSFVQNHDIGIKLEKLPNVRQ